MSVAAAPVPISKGALGIPNRWFIYGVAGVGKTHLASFWPRPYFLCSPGETGIQTLIETGQADDQIGNTEFFDWSSVWQQLDWIGEGSHDYKTLVFDTIGGFEMMWLQHIASLKYGGNLESLVAMSYGTRGIEKHVNDVTKFLSKLQEIRARRKIGVVFLAHCETENFKNPEGPDFHRYWPALDRETRPLYINWADATCFLRHRFYAAKESKDALRAKGVDGGGRVLCTQWNVAYEAKNRLNLQAEIDMGESASEAWSNLKAAIVSGKTKQVEVAESVSSN